MRTGLVAGHGRGQGLSRAALLDVHVELVDHILVDLLDLSLVWRDRGCGLGVVILEGVAEKERPIALRWLVAILRSSIRHRLLSLGLRWRRSAPAPVDVLLYSDFALRGVRGELVGGNEALLLSGDDPAVRSVERLLIVDLISLSMNGGSILVRFNRSDYRWQEYLIAFVVREAEQSGLITLECHSCLILRGDVRDDDAFAVLQREFAFGVVSESFVDLLHSQSTSVLRLFASLLVRLYFIWVLQSVREKPFTISGGVKDEVEAFVLIQEMHKELEVSKGLAEFY